MKCPVCWRYAHIVRGVIQVHTFLNVNFRWPSAVCPMSGQPAPQEVSV